MINITKPLSQESAAALGLFDGVHLGHQKVISAAVRSKAEGLMPCAFTFNTETFPKKHGKPFEFLCTEEHKKDILREMGIERVYTGSFAEIGEMDGESFCRDILKGILNVKKVFCGRDFRFGKGAAWGFSELSEFGRQMNFEAVAVEAVNLEGSRVSSTRIREFLSGGKPEKAAELLGRPYEICGEVIHGKALGRTISFPTINQRFCKGQLVPARGVYLSRVTTDGGKFFGVTNIGVKPTVSEENIPLAETNLFDFKGDLYGEYCVTELLRFLRPERKFDNITALKAAISQDCENARILAETIQERKKFHGK